MTAEFTSQDLESTDGRATRAVRSGWRIHEDAGGWMRGGHARPWDRLEAWPVEGAKRSDKVWPARTDVRTRPPPGASAATPSEACRPDPRALGAGESAGDFRLVAAQSVTCNESLGEATTYTTL